MQSPDAMRRGKEERCLMALPLVVVPRTSAGTTNTGSGAAARVQPAQAAPRICEAAPSVFESLFPHLPQAGESVGDERRPVEECQRGLAETQ
jgi:hypothetical protein